MSKKQETVKVGDKIRVQIRPGAFSQIIYDVLAVEQVNETKFVKIDMTTPKFHRVAVDNVEIVKTAEIAATSAIVSVDTQTPQETNGGTVEGEKRHDLKDYHVGDFFAEFATAQDQRVDDLAALVAALTDQRDYLDDTLGGVLDLLWTATERLAKSRNQVKALEAENDETKRAAGLVTVAMEARIIDLTAKLDASISNEDAKKAIEFNDGIWMERLKESDSRFEVSSKHAFEQMARIAELEAELERKEIQLRCLDQAVKDEQTKLDAAQKTAAAHLAANTRLNEQKHELERQLAAAQHRGNELFTGHFAQGKDAA
jgi:hypothetical protein